MQVRWPIAIVALFVSLFVLFGSFFGYQWLNVEKPIRSAVQHTDHITLEKIQVAPDRVSLQLRPDAQFSLVKDYLPLREDIQSHAGNRKVDVQFTDQSDPALKEAWNQMVFGVREGISHQQFTGVSKTVKEVAEEEGIGYRLGMDETFVYVELHRGDRFLYQVLPLEQPEGEVKDHG